jgi:hypothetical protein
LDSVSPSAPSAGGQTIEDQYGAPDLAQLRRPRGAHVGVDDVEDATLATQRPQHDPAGVHDADIAVPAAQHRWIHLVVRRRQTEERLATFGAYDDHDLVFARVDGTPIPPHQVTLGFQRLARHHGLPVMRFHDARHTAASIAL